MQEQSDNLLQGFTYEFLHSLFSYDPETGLITRKITTSGRSLQGYVVGSLDGKGYLHVSVQKTFIRLHRLAYFLYYGWVPPKIDHKNRIKTDNKILNLRPTEPKTNAGNCVPHAHNTSGYKGASLNSHSGKWHAQLKINGKQTYLGRFDTAEEAAKAYDEAAKKHFGKDFAWVNYA